MSNGVALCKLHHAAFDRFFFAIRPDYLIEVRGQVDPRGARWTDARGRPPANPRDADPRASPSRRPTRSQAPRASILRAPASQLTPLDTLAGTAHPQSPGHGRPRQHRQPPLPRRSRRPCRARRPPVCRRSPCRRAPAPAAPRASRSSATASSSSAWSWSTPGLAAFVAERPAEERAGLVERALRIGLTALQEAGVTVNVDVVRREFEALLAQTQATNEKAARGPGRRPPPELRRRRRPPAAHAREVPRRPRRAADASSTSCSTSRSATARSAA